MSNWEGPFPPRAAPIRVKGGIRARTARGAIGRQWWSRRFIEVLESFDLRGRLARGRTYARQGQVIALEIASGEVNATVQGSRPTPYRVRIGLAPLPEPAWQAAESALAAQALYCARLLAGEMPGEIEEVFVDAGAPLFPRRATDLRMSCTCPDATVPCKHLAATFYLLAEAFDDDPFRILQWRGRDRDRLLSRLRDLRGGAGGGSAAGTAGSTGEVSQADAGGGAAPATDVAAALAEVTSPSLADTLDRFWLPPVPLPGEPPPTLPTEPDLLLRQLPTPPATLGGNETARRLRRAYLRFPGTPTT
jgi:uncharacterized Zn finger protein